MCLFYFRDEILQKVPLRSVGGFGTAICEYCMRVNLNVYPLQLLQQIKVNCPHLFLNKKHGA